MAFLKGIDLGSLKETLDAGMKAVQDGVAGIDVGGLAQNAKDAVGSRIASFDIGEAAQGAKGAVASGVEMAGTALGGAIRGDDGSEGVESAKELVELLWCLAYVDGVITSEEREVLGQSRRSWMRVTNHTRWKSSSSACPSCRMLGRSSDSRTLRRLRLRRS